MTLKLEGFSLTGIYEAYREGQNKGVRDYLQGVAGKIDVSGVKHLVDPDEYSSRERDLLLQIRALNQSQEPNTDPGNELHVRALRCHLSDELNSLRGVKIPRVDIMSTVRGWG
jgi:hypothetical protein